MSKSRSAWFVVLLATVFAGCGASPSSGAPTAPSTAMATQTPPPVGTVIATISGIGTLLGQYSGYAVAVDTTAVWVHNAEVGVAARIDPATNAVVAQIDVGLERV